jgi:4-hydroxybenzoyl-CoA reductase subunit alpha
MPSYSIIGKRIPRVDGVPKATGEAKFAGDLISPDMLFGKILRSPHAHAKILNIDISKALKVHGVRAIITGKDTPGRKYGSYPDPALRDEYPLSIDKVRFVGDEIAAVAAIDEDIAEDALDLIQVDYEIMPAVFDVEEAIKPGAPVIHENRPNNIANTLKLKFGDVDGGFQKSDYIFENRFTTHAVTAASLEPQTVVAKFDFSGRLTIWRPVQGPYSPQEDLAVGLDMPPAKIRIIKPYMGGGFGGKRELLALDFCASLLSKKTGRSVKIVHTREEDFLGGRHRHPFIVELKTGVKKDGKIMAKRFKLISDTGAYRGKGPAVMGLAMATATLVYHLPNVELEGYVVYTNNPNAGGHRGFGNPQIRFADESQMEMIAEQLGIDPITLRLKNTNKPGTITPNKWKITSCGLDECIRRVSQSSNFKKKHGKLSFGKGIGIATLGHISGYKAYQPFDSSGAIIKLNQDGTATLLTGATDVGQGADTTLSMIAAEILGIPIENIRLTAADTELTPVDLGTFGSRVTFIAGNAVKLAALDARNKLFRFAAKALKVKPSDLKAQDGRIYAKRNKKKGMSFSEAVTEGLKTHDKKGMIVGYGYYNTKTDLVDYKTGAGNLSPSYTFGAQVAEVEVDVETGQVEVKKITAAQDLGFAINPMAVEGQLQGAIHMGLGYTLSERMIRAEGKILNPSYRDYGILTSLDIPEIESILVETIDPEGPFGAKGIAESALIPVAPAIANAIYDAIGIRIKELPITPEKICAALKEKAESIRR